jgi:hypothetical protein
MTEDGASMLQPIALILTPIATLSLMSAGLIDASNTAF